MFRNYHNIRTIGWPAGGSDKLMCPHCRHVCGPRERSRRRHTLLIYIFIFHLPCVGGTRRLDAGKDRFVNFSPHIERHWKHRAANCSGWMLFGKVSVRNCQNMPRFIEGPQCGIGASGGGSLCWILFLSFFLFVCPEVGLSCLGFTCCCFDVFAADLGFHLW